MLQSSHGESCPLAAQIQAIDRYLVIIQSCELTSSLKGAACGYQQNTMDQWFGGGGCGVCRLAMGCRGI
jgi:hypothetical protein